MIGMGASRKLPAYALVHSLPPHRFAPVAVPYPTEKGRDPTMSTLPVAVETCIRPGAEGRGDTKWLAEQSNVEVGSDGCRRARVLVRVA